MGILTSHFSVSDAEKCVVLFSTLLSPIVEQLPGLEFHSALLVSLRKMSSAITNYFPNAMMASEYTCGPSLSLLVFINVAC